MKIKICCFIAFFCIAKVNAQGVLNTQLAGFVGSKGSVTKINAGAILDKIGVTNLIGTIDKLDKDSKSVETNVKKAQFSKLITEAMDLTKPVYVKSLDLPQSGNEYFQKIFGTICTVVPIKNKAITISIMKELSADYENEKYVYNEKTKKSTWVKSNKVTYPELMEANGATIIYMPKSESFVVVDENNMYISTVDNQIWKAVKNEENYGKIIKRDTIRNKYVNERPFAESNNEIKKPENLREIDKVVDGKVIRVLSYNRKKEIEWDAMGSDTTLSISAASPAVAETTTVYAVTSTPAAEVKSTKEIIKYTPPTFTGEPKSGNKSLPKTKTYTEYLIDGGYVEVTYIPYDAATRKIKVAEAKRNATASVATWAAKVVAIANEPFNTALQKELEGNSLDEANADMVMMTNNGISNAFNMMFAGIANTVETKKVEGPSYSTTVINFENGKVNMKMQANCCDKTADLINKFYKPLVAKEISVLGRKPFATMSYNIDLNTLLNESADGLGIVNYIKMFGKMPFEYSEITAAFTGEVHASVLYSKRMPVFVAMLKVADKQAAVKFTNMLASYDESLQGTEYYKYSDDGNYLYLLSKERSSWLDEEKEPTPTVTERFAAIQATDINGQLNYGYTNFSMAGFMQMFNSFVEVYTNGKEDAYDKIRRQQEEARMKEIESTFKQAVMYNNKLETGVFVTEMNWGIGTENKNALKTIFEFANNMIQIEEKFSKEKDALYNSPEWKNRYATSTPAATYPPPPPAKRPAAKRVPVKKAKK